MCIKEPRCLAEIRFPNLKIVDPHFRLRQDRLLMGGEVNDYRIALNRFIKERLPPHHLITITAYNAKQTYSVDAFQRYFHELFKWLDRLLLGTRFNLKPIDQRTHAIAIPHLIDINTHYHLLVRRPVLTNDVDFFYALDRAAAKAFTTNKPTFQVTTDLEQIHHLEAAISYCTREIKNGSKSMEEFIVIPDARKA